MLSLKPISFKIKFYYREDFYSWNHLRIKENLTATYIFMVNVDDMTINTGGHLFAYHPNTFIVYYMTQNKSDHYWHINDMAYFLVLTLTIVLLGWFINNTEGS